MRPSPRPLTPSAKQAEPVLAEAATPDDPPPKPPQEPDPADCCGEGCVNCVFDVYEAAVERYEVALAAWRQRHVGQNG
ncbi:MAG: oxidoreductase-like domain-containing protein [Rhodanobacteraceae bacterium]